MSKFNHILLYVVLIVSFYELSESRKISLHLHHHEVFEVRPQHLVERDDFEYKEPSLHFYESKADENQHDNTTTKGISSEDGKVIPPSITVTSARSQNEARHLTRHPRAAVDYYDEDASFIERYFIHLITFTTFAIIASIMGLIYCFCCQRGLCPCCCQGMARDAMQKWMLGADVDSRGNVHYRELNEEEREIAAELHHQFHP